MTGGALRDTTQIEVEDRFIECWGQIAGLWGVNRSIGRIHALLYLSPEPISSEAITERLRISHGNCSTSLRELLTWSVVRRVHRPGERKALYESEQDPWTWFHATIRERRRREVVPVLESLSDVRDFASQNLKGARGKTRKELEESYQRIDRFTNFVEEFVVLIDAFLAAGHGPMGKALRTVAKLVPKK
ncbi:MAG: hypothetical protein AAF581_15240 [Planctomycetota bacterium]